MKFIFSLSILILLSFISAANGFTIKPPSKVFVNVVAKDPSDELSKSFRARLGVRGRLGRLTKRQNIEAVEPNPKAAKIASAMVEKVPYLLATKGFGLELEENFQEGPYVVMQLNVRHVDDAKMKEVPKSAGYVVQRILKFIGAKDQRKLDEYVMKKLLEKEMPSVVAKLSAASGVEADTILRQADKQQSYHDTKLKELRSLAAKLKK